MFWGGLFIKRRTVDSPPPLADLRGDNRSWQIESSPTRFRAYMRYDFNSGRGLLRVNFTCTVHGRCKSAHKASSGFFCTNCVYAQRHFLDQFFLIEWRLKNSIHPRSIAPRRRTYSLA